MIIAPGFEFNLFADPSQVAEFSTAASGPTAIAFDARGRLFVATFTGRILILLDNNDDGTVDQVKTFASGIPIPLGIEFHPNGDLYCTSNLPGGAGRILRLRDLDGNDTADEIATIVDGLPSEGDHQTDRLKFGPDGLLYFGQGSSTDNGQPNPGRPPERPLNATILRVDVETSALSQFASGLRNPFGMAFHPETGALFSTDGGSGEICQIPPCPPDTSPPEEINWVVEGGNYGFPNCEGTPTADNPNCAGVTAPVAQFLPHLTPTSIAFYTGPQAGDHQNFLLITLFKRFFADGGDLKRLRVSGDPATGFQLTEIKPPIAEFGIIDPFDGPIDTAIDPISGDVYVARFDPVQHRDPNEHHHFIYRIHREGSDKLPFIGPVRPSSIKAGSANSTIRLTGRHIGTGATIVANGIPLPTRQGADSFELLADLPGNMISAAGMIEVVVQRPDGERSNTQSLTVIEEIKLPVITSLVVRKKTGKIIQQVTVGMRAKKLRLVVGGTEFGAGAQLLIDGVAVELDSATEAELVGRFTADMLSSPRELVIQVRNAAARLSNSIRLVIAPE